MTYPNYSLNPVINEGIHFLPEACALYVAIAPYTNDANPLATDKLRPTATTEYSIALGEEG